MDSIKSNRGSSLKRRSLILQTLGRSMSALTAIIALAITPNTALADETDDSLAGLTDEQLSQLDGQLGIMPLAQCSESGGSEAGAGGQRQSLVAVDMLVDGVETHPPTTTGGGYGETHGNTLSGGLVGGIYRFCFRECSTV